MATMRGRMKKKKTYRYVDIAPPVFGSEAGPLSRLPPAPGLSQ
jgi:hypothetical protein